MHRRTALITAASIVAVVLTGAAAVGANIGILSSASASDIGELTAVAQVAPIPTVEATATATVEPTPQGASLTTQAFEADAGGIVNVHFSADELRLGSVSPNTGWSWSSAQSGDAELTVSFVSADGEELEFVATLLPDGSITAKVDENIVQTVQGEPEVITVHTQATPGPTTELAASPTSAPTTAAAQTLAAQPNNPDTGQAPPAATPAPASPAPTVDYDDDDFDEDDEYEDSDEDDHDDEYEDEDDEHDEDEYEGADDDD